MIRRLLAAVAVMVLVINPASASITVKEFRKLKADEQTLYIAASVSMLAYSYAANDDIVKARCVQDYFFGKPGETAPGPKAIAVELAVAEVRDPEKFKVEGIIMALTNQACSKAPSAPAPSR